MHMNEHLHPVGRPIVLFGGEATWFGSMGGIIESASEHEFYSVDVDLRSSWMAPSWAAIGPRLARTMIRIRSVWIPGMLSGAMSIQRTDRLMEFLAGSRNDLGLRTIVIPRAAHIRRGSSMGPPIRELASDRSGANLRIAVGIRAIDLASERDHLEHLLSIRHLAEEWDLDVALDLTGHVPRDWEAEAAIIRLLPRLALIRMSPVIGEGVNPRSITTQSIAARSVAILADQGYSGSISLAPAARPFRSRFVARGPGVSEMMARDAVLDRYDQQRLIAHQWDIAKRLIPPEVI